MACLKTARAVILRPVPKTDSLEPDTSQKDVGKLRKLEVQKSKYENESSSRDAEAREPPK